MCYCDVCTIYDIPHFSSSTRLYPRICRLVQILTHPVTLLLHVTGTDCMQLFCNHLRSSSIMFLVSRTLMALLMSSALVEASLRSAVVVASFDSDLCSSSSKRTSFRLRAWVSPDGGHQHILVSYFFTIGRRRTIWFWMKSNEKDIESVTEPVSRPLPTGRACPSRRTSGWSGITFR